MKQVSVTVTNETSNHWVVLCDTMEKAMFMQVKSACFRALDRHYKSLSRDEQKTFLAQTQIGDELPQIDEIELGKILFLLNFVKIPVTVTIG